MREFEPLDQIQEDDELCSTDECEFTQSCRAARSYSGEEFEYRLERMTTKSARDLVHRGSNQQLKSAVDQMHRNSSSMHKAIVVLNQLSVELDIHQAMRNIQVTATQLLQCEKVTLFLVDPENEELRAYLAEGNLISLNYGEGIAGSVAAAGKGLNIKDAYKCSLFSQRIDKETGYRTKSILCVPIIDARYKVVAVLQAVNKVGGGIFTYEDEANVLLLGRHLGNTVTKSKMFETIRTEKQRLALLSTSHQLLTTQKNLSEFIEQALVLVHQLVRGEIACMFLVDQAANEVWSASRSQFGRDLEFEGGEVQQSSSVYKKPVSRYSINEQGILSSVAKGEGSVVVSGENWQKDPQLSDVIIDLSSYQLEEVRVRSILVQAVQSSVKEKVLAIIVVVNRVIAKDDILFNACFRDDERHAMQVLANQCGDYLDRNTLDVSFASALSTIAASMHDELSAQLNLFQGQLDYYTTGRRTSLPLSSMFQQLRSRSQSGASSILDVAIGSCGHTYINSFDDLRAWDLDLLVYNTSDLVPLVYDMFSNLHIIETLQTDSKTMFNFIRSALQVYNEVPYHNACHATYVVHSVYMIVLEGQLLDHLKDIELASLMVASLAHDLDHNGYTNQFHVHTGSQWALMYNDQSVLENHHCAMLFALLQNPENDILANLTSPIKRLVRKLAIQLILATDMAQHAGLMTDLKSFGEISPNMEEKDRVLLMQGILHAADISNSVRPMSICYEMGNRVHEEFGLQVKKEEELGIPSAPHMKATSLATQYQLEMSFNSYIVLPYWQQMAELCPPLQARVEQIIQNNSSYQELFQKAQNETQNNTKDTEQNNTKDTTD